jgi:hypothetical protein
MEPHFDLFTYLFHLKSQPNDKVPYEVGSAGLQLRQGMEKKYISYKFPCSLSGWREKWFYIGNHTPSLPKRTARALRITRKWSKPCRDESQITELPGIIKKQRDAGVTSVVVMFSWIDRRIQPLQKRARFGCEYCNAHVFILFKLLYQSLA